LSPTLRGATQITAGLFGCYCLRQTVTEGTAEINSSLIESG
jgi:hypothetical protein